MELNGIRYFGFKELGSPKEIRERFHQDKDYNTFFKDYEFYLKTQPETMTMITSAIEGNPD